MAVIYFISAFGVIFSRSCRKRIFSWLCVWNAGECGLHYCPPTQTLLRNSL